MRNFPENIYQVAEGDWVVTRWTATATHDGPFNGIQPTGRRAVVTGTNTKRFNGNKVVEEWVNFDMFGILQQIGAIPAMA